MPEALGSEASGVKLKPPVSEGAQGGVSVLGHVWPSSWETATTVFGPPLVLYNTGVALPSNATSHPSPPKVPRHSGAAMPAVVWILLSCRAPVVMLAALSGLIAKL